MAYLLLLQFLGSKGYVLNEYFVLNKGIPLKS